MQIMTTNLYRFHDQLQSILITQTEFSTVPKQVSLCIPEQTPKHTYYTKISILPTYLTFYSITQFKTHSLITLKLEIPPFYLCSALYLIFNLPLARKTMYSIADSKNIH